MRYNSYRYTRSKNTSPLIYLSSGRKISLELCESRIARGLQEFIPGIKYGDTVYFNLSNWPT